MELFNNMIFYFDYGKESQECKPPTSIVLMLHFASSYSFNSQLLWTMKLAKQNMCSKHEKIENKIIMSSIFFEIVSF
jgi:hypothetical protein